MSSSINTPSPAADVALAGRLQVDSEIGTLRRVILHRPDLLGDLLAETLASELGRGRGGPRCMSCPIERDPLQEGAP